MTTIKQHLDKARTTLSANGIETAALDARLLLQQATGKTVENLLLDGDSELDEDKAQTFNMLIQRRANHEPVAKIIGKKEFYGRDFITTVDTLDPRPDSEILVETVLNKISRDRTIRVLDIGTGTGCLLLSLLAECPDWMGIGVDISNSALDVARHNAANLGLDKRCEFIQSDCFDSVSGSFDVIISNPPYIAENETSDLDKDVVDFEPHLALFVPEDGLYFYRVICESGMAFLSADGWMFFEVGHTQAAAVETLMKKNAFAGVDKKKDLSGIYRVVCGAAQK